MISEWSIQKGCFPFSILIIKKINCGNQLLQKRGDAYFDDRWDLRIDVVVGEMKARSERAFVQQRVLVKLNLSTGIPLIQAHSAVGKVDHLP